MFIKSCVAVLTLLLPAFAFADEMDSEQMFIVHFETGANWDESAPPAEQPQFHEHSANLKRLRQERTILFGARYADLGVIIIRADSLDSANALISADPGVQAGIFEYRVESLSVFYPWQQP